MYLAVRRLNSNKQSGNFRLFANIIKVTSGGIGINCYRAVQRGHKKSKACSLDGRGKNYLFGHPLMSDEPDTKEHPGVLYI